MGVGKGLLAFGIAAVGLLVALALFPSFRTMFGLVDTSEMDTLLATIVTAFPYLLLAFLVFWGVAVSRSR